MKLSSTVATTLILIASVCPLEAQRGIRVEGRVSGVLISSGNASVDRVINRAATVSLGWMAEKTPIGLEGFYTFSPMDNDPYHRSPRMQMGGLLAEIRVGSYRGFSAFGSGGAGFIKVDPTPSEFCGPPNCLDEGGSHFAAASLPTLIARFGVDIPIGGGFRVRPDVRAHVPLGGDNHHADTKKIRLEFGIGAAYRF